MTMMLSKIVNATGKDFEIELDLRSGKHEVIPGEEPYTIGGTRITMRGDLWLDVAYELVRVHGEGVDTLDITGQVERVRRMLHIAMERSVSEGQTRERNVARAVAGALHQLAEFVAMERVVSFQFSWSGGSEQNPVVLTQFAMGPLTPIVLDLGVVDRAAKLA